MIAGPGMSCTGNQGVLQVLVQALNEGKAYLVALFRLQFSYITGIYCSLQTRSQFYRLISTTGPL